MSGMTKGSVGECVRQLIEASGRGVEASATLAILDPSRLIRALCGTR